MSKQAILFEGSSGLLGEYCPTLRKKNEPLSDRINCMYHASYQEFRCCDWVQLCFTKEEEIELSAPDSLKDFYILKSSISSL